MKKVGGERKMMAKNLSKENPRPVTNRLFKVGFVLEIVATATVVSVAVYRGLQAKVTGYSFDRSATACLVYSYQPNGSACIISIRVEKEVTIATIQVNGMNRSTFSFTDYPGPLLIPLEGSFPTRAYPSASNEYAVDGGLLKLGQGVNITVVFEAGQSISTVLVAQTP
jgi:hypothetical protein